MREKYCWLVTDKPNEQGDGFSLKLSIAICSCLIRWNWQIRGHLKHRENQFQVDTSTFETAAEIPLYFTMRFNKTSRIRGEEKSPVRHVSSAPHSSSFPEPRQTNQTL
jgi:hypothetical protein